MAYKNDEKDDFGFSLCIRMCRYSQINVSPWNYMTLESQKLIAQKQNDQKTVSDKREAKNYDTFYSENTRIWLALSSQLIAASLLLAAERWVYSSDEGWAFLVATAKGNRCAPADAQFCEYRINA